MNSDQEARIRQRAYEIWQREGRPEGREDEHWQRAQAEIMAEDGAAANQAPNRAAAGSKPQSEPPSPTPPPRRRTAAKPEGGRPASPRRGRKPTEP